MLFVITIRFKNGRYVEGPIFQVHCASRAEAIERLSFIEHSYAEYMGVML